MIEYENKPHKWQVKRWKKARKNYLKWYDESCGFMPKNTLKNVETMQRLYSTKNKLYV